MFWKLFEDNDTKWFATERLSVQILGVSHVTIFLLVVLGELLEEILEESLEKLASSWISGENTDSIPGGNSGRNSWTNLERTTWGYLWMYP